MLTLSDEERKSLSQKAGISNIGIGSAEVLAIKADMAIPWNRMRLLRWSSITKYNLPQLVSIASYSHLATCM